MTLDLRQSKADQEAAQRISDTVRLHLLAHKDKADVIGLWCVFKLEDGTSDNVLYDCKDDAVRAMRSRCKDYCYLTITPDGISPESAYSFLRTNRMPYIDTTAPEHVINPHIYPRMSNLTTEQKRTIKRQAVEDWKANG